MTDWKNPPKLFIPGPVHVLDEVYQQLARPTLAHRAKEYSDLHGETVTLLKKILFTEQNVFICSSSGSGGWETAARNLISDDETVLCCMCGAFSDKWASVFALNGKKVEELKVEWGQAVTAEMIDEKLSNGNYAAISLAYNETSTGVTNPLEDICKMMQEKHPEVLILVDSVSAMVGLPIKFDEWKIDMTFASVQKAFSIPPGVAVFAVSERAMAKSKTVSNRGYYFDLQQYAKNAAKDQTPTTPAIPQIMALNYQCNRLVAEGMENVWARHKEMADFVRDWAKKNFGLFAPQEYASNTLTAIANTRGIDIASLIKTIKEKHNLLFGNGYGSLKEKNFRIAHMGDMDMESLKQLLSYIDQEIN